jgi:hypothetical protein
MEPIFKNDWKEDGINGLQGDFQLKDGELEGVEVLFADYTYEDYEGDAYVLFRKDSKLFEVYGSHCSCYGLEDQWEPEETDIETLIGQMARSGKLWEPELIAIITKLATS